jgi:CO/xanthine dehydrogenase Mo-binding subunit
MTTQHVPAGLIGASIRRVEDPVLVTGKGCFTDDVQLPGMLYLAILRSPYPHAKITSINTDAARAIPGVELVLTGADIDIHIPSPVMIEGQKRTRRARSKSSTSRCRRWSTRKRRSSPARRSRAKSSTPTSAIAR